MTSNPPPAPNTSINTPFSKLSIDTSSLPPCPLSIDEKLGKLASIQGLPFEPKIEDELRTIFNTYEHPIAYDGFEPSGRVTLSSGLLRMINAKRLMEAGCIVRLLIADSHAFLNNKYGGDLKKLSSVGLYMMQVWKALGLDPETNANIEIYLASTIIPENADKYWSTVLDIASRFTVERVQLCCETMGRQVTAEDGSEAIASTMNGSMNTNRVMYPLMQCADGFLLDADIYQMGQDQEAAFQLTQEYMEKLHAIGKPAKSRVFLPHEVLRGLKQEQWKMSATDPESALYMDDTPVEIKSKIKKAFCPPGEIENNPILLYFKMIIFPLYEGKGITIERSEKNGGPITFQTYGELETAFSREEVHPGDLKPCLSDYLIQILEPVRLHFANGELKKLWTNVKKLKISPLPDGDKLTTAPIPAIPDPETPRTYRESTLSPEERYAISRSVGEECVQDSELKFLMEKKIHPICYDGFEPSGRMHIAQGVLRTVNVNRLTTAGSIFRFWVADWFALLNHKMGGDLEKIRLVGKYMVEIWKSTGMDMTNVEFLWASNEIIANGSNYWLRVMDIARRTTIARTIKCCTIMGRKEKSGMMAAQILYPLMQCADIFFLRADICQLGLDQRKINMLARDYCDLVKLKFKPVIISHHMLMGLMEGQEKMSKSNPESAIFMEDAAEDVVRKINNAFCPVGTVNANPILDYMKHIICPSFVETPEGVVVHETKFVSYEDIEAAYVAGDISPEQLKSSLASYLNRLLEPVRNHFASGEPAELLAKVRSFRTTR